MKKFTFGGGRLNLLLVVVLIALLYIAIEKPGLETHINTNKITQLNPNKIQQIEIVSADEKKVFFLKKNSTWYIKSNGNQLNANQNKIAQILELLNSASLKSFPALPNDLEQYHLSNPRLTVKFDDLSITFGDSEPIKHRRYILIDNKIHLITDFHYHLLLQPASAYILAND